MFDVKDKVFSREGDGIKGTAEGEGRRDVCGS
jgi:hypothetical protein